jgi:hypothetical protein
MLNLELLIIYLVYQTLNFITMKSTTQASNRDKARNFRTWP